VLLGREALKAIVKTDDPRTAAQLGHSLLMDDGAVRTAWYRLTHRGLERVAAFDGPDWWGDTPHVLSPIPGALDPLLLEHPPECVTLGESWQLDSLQNGFALALAASGTPAGVLFVQLAGEGQVAGDATLDFERASVIAALVAACFRIAHDGREMRRMREEHYEHLIRSETLAATGMLSAGVAHELNNPLGVVLGLAQILVAEEDLPEPLREDMQVILAESGRAVRVVNQLLSYGRGGGLELEQIELSELLESCATMLEARVATPRLTVVRDIPPGPWMVMGDPFRLQQAVLAIMDNSRQAIVDAGRDEGRIEIALGINTGRSVWIRITDDGPGISEEALPRIFDPFFTTREVGQGTGMGLALVHRTVRDLGGDIRCQNLPDGGACFVISLDRIQND
jgi:signal transduction histidine kinase